MRVPKFPVRDIVNSHKTVCALEQRCQVPLPGVSREEVEEIRWRYDEELDKIQQLSDELSAIGCELKDVRRGIVDFRALHQGRIIEFCWRHGEETIQHWHGLDDGFHDRRLIDADFFAEATPAESPF